MKGSCDRDNQDLRTAVVIAEAELAVLLLSGTLDFGEINERYI